MKTYLNTLRDESKDSVEKYKKQTIVNPYRGITIRALGKGGKCKFNPMTQLPQQVEGEDFSRTVLVYDKDLEDVDLGFYNFDTEKWDVLGGFQMDLICWSEIPKPNQFQVGQFKTHLTD